MEDQKRRTMEALERRFAQAKAEVHSQQHKGKKRPAEDHKQVYLHVESLCANSPVNRPLPRSSSTKGNSFLGRTSKEGCIKKNPNLVLSPSLIFYGILISFNIYPTDARVDEPAYLKLSQYVHENLLPNDVQVSEGKMTIDGVLHELLQHGDSARKYKQGSKSIKIENTILLDNYVEKTGSSCSGRIRSLRNGSKHSKKHLSLKQHKRIGTFDLPKEFHNFELFKPMQEKWKSYVQQLLKIVGKDQLAPCFLTADLHGAIILVVQCKTAAYVGIHGIMVRETKETFGIVTQVNKFRVVPKKHSVFVLQADCWKIRLLGDKLVSRNLVP